MVDLWKKPIVLYMTAVCNKEEDDPLYWNDSEDKITSHIPQEYRTSTVGETLEYAVNNLHPNNVDENLAEEIVSHIRDHINTAADNPDYLLTVREVESGSTIGITEEFGRVVETYGKVNTLEEDSEKYVSLDLIIDGNGIGG